VHIGALTRKWVIIRTVFELNTVPKEPSP
jgi:hypothetical protein